MVACLAILPLSQDKEKNTLPCRSSINSQTVNPDYGSLQAVLPRNGSGWPERWVFWGKEGQIYPEQKQQSDRFHHRAMQETGATLPRRDAELWRFWASQRHCSLPQLPLPLSRGSSAIQGGEMSAWAACKGLLKEYLLGIFFCFSKLGIVSLTQRIKNVVLLHLVKKMKCVQINEL